ncbi:MAG: type II toxin-antitoxin system prevent-host-death family antitoxin [Deltaproteobacteria bacterium]|nr:type II toxin-antitoxin system prevent-host-death family antitoxin [Deltaproteobacteria bacterium]
METLKVGELKTNFSDVLKKVKAGHEIIISFGKKDEKIAVLVPYETYRRRAPRRLGILKGKAEAKIKDNFQITDEEFLSS